MKRYFADPFAVQMVKSNVINTVAQTVRDYEANGVLTFDECDPNLTGLAARLEAIVNSADETLAGSKTVWYDNKQTPLTKYYFDDIDKKEGDTLLEAMKEGAKAVCRLARWSQGMYLVQMIAGWMRALPCKNPSNDPNYIKNKVAWANAILDDFFNYHYCVDPNDLIYPDLCLTTEAREDEVQLFADGRKQTRQCRGIVGSGTTESRVEEMYYAIPSVSKQLVRRRITARQKLASMRSNAYDLVSAINQGIGVARDKIDAVKALVHYEEVHDVNADFKVELTENFVRVAEQKIEDQVNPPSRVNKFEPPSEGSILPQILAGVFGVVLGVAGAKLYVERQG